MLGLPKLGLGLPKIYRKYVRVTEIRVSFAENILKFAKNTENILQIQKIQKFYRKYTENTENIPKLSAI